ncbi:MAG TPA: prepilin peptidase [Candidatus Limnocylindria bacterium]|nr:prepilin peptidase [Candidatus Limnocylindria bacterium]
MVYVALILLGLCFGSFVNAFVWRLHEQETRKKLTRKQKKDLSVVHGRSMCPHCKHGLAWYDLLPVVSWVGLRGKCRYCGHKIDDSPLVELLAALLFTGSYLAWPYGFTAGGWLLFGLWLIFLVCFLALAVYDLRWMELPNRIVYPLIVLAAVQTVVKAVVLKDGTGTVIGALLGFLVIGGLFYGLFQLSGGKWIGGGDVKLAFMIGPLVGGATASMLVIFLASLAGTLVSLPLMALKSLRITSRIPFGPFLLLATVIVYLLGESIIDWYVRGLWL